MSLVNIGLLSLIEIFGDFELKNYARTDSIKHLFNGLLGYAGVIYFLIRSLRVGNIMYVNGMWDGISGLIESFAAYVLLGERFNNLYQYIGLIMVFCGTMLLHLGGITH